MFFFVFFFKQKTAYEIVSRDWSSDVCSSDLHPAVPLDSDDPDDFVCWIDWANLPRDTDGSINVNMPAGLETTPCSIFAANYLAIVLEDVAGHVLVDEIGRASCRERV